MKTEWDKYVELVHGMSLDSLLGKGPTKKAYVSTLRMIADQMEPLISSSASDAPEDKRDGLATKDTRPPNRPGWDGKMHGPWENWKDPNGRQCS